MTTKDEYDKLITDAIAKANGGGSIDKAPTMKQDASGDWYQWDPSRNQWVPAPGLPSYKADPTEAGAMADLKKRQLEAQVAALESKNKDDGTLALRQHFKLIDDVQKRMAMPPGTPGAMSLDDGNRLITLSKQNLDAAFQGTTPWQMKQAEEAKGRAAASQARAEEQQQFSNLMTRGNLGRGVTNDRAGMGQNMAELLLKSAMSMWSQAASGVPGAAQLAQFDPLKAASKYTSEYYPQDLSDAAKAVLINALQGIGAGGPSGPVQGPAAAPSMQEPPVVPTVTPPAAQVPVTPPIPQRPLGEEMDYGNSQTTPSPDEIDRLAQSLMAASRGGW